METFPPPVALITGSGRPRLGSVIARQLADSGYRIAVPFSQLNLADAEGSSRIAGDKKYGSDL